MRWLDAVAMRIYSSWRMGGGGASAMRWGSRVAYVLCALIIITALPVLVCRWVPPPVSAFMMEDRAAAFLRGDDDFRVRYEWVGTDRVATVAKLAVVAAEDQKFPTHDGFDLDAISEAWADYQSGESRRGGSTISQQVARNLFLWRGGGFFRKGLEAYFTVLMETLWPKRRILEVYLNVAEFGRGIYGVKAASEVYFGKQPSALTRREAALLAAVLPSPRRMRPDRPSDYVNERARQIIAQMSKLGPSLLEDM